MRILAFSDIHEDEAALEALSKISSGFDHIFICGDSSNSQIFLDGMLKMLSNSFIIPGNWESKLINKLLCTKGQCIHKNRAELGDGLNVVGFGYSNITPFGTYGELTEEEIYKQMSDLPIDENTLLMLHCPPKGYFDTTPKGDSVGSDSILRIIQEKKPLAAFFGHIHEHSGIFELGHTTLIKLPAANTMQACAVSITDKKISAEFISL